MYSNDTRYELADISGNEIRVISELKTNADTVLSDLIAYVQEETTPQSPRYYETPNMSRTTITVNDTPMSLFSWTTTNNDGKLETLYELADISSSYNIRIVLKLQPADTFIEKFLELIDDKQEMNSVLFDNRVSE
jgi:hypothetical protein